MSNRFPLIVNPITKRIEELSSGDNLNLQNSGIVGTTTITAVKFFGSLEGNATSSDSLNYAGNITAGTISSSRLSGYYGIDVNSANILTNAANITSGFIGSERLNGYYPIGVSTSNLSYSLSNAANIVTGIIDPARLTGAYNINVSSASTALDLLPGNYNVNILGNAATATTATNLSGGNVTGTSLNITGFSTLGITAVTSLTVTNTATIGYSTITNAYIGVATVGFLTATNINVSGTSTVGFLTATNISTPNATIGLLTATTSNVTNAGITSLTVDYIKGKEITSLDYINSGIASVGIATIGIASITNAYIGILTVGNIYSTGIFTATTFSGNLTGTATTATNLADASGITTGIIDPARLSGTYDITITGDSQASTATTATNVIGGIASVTQLSVGPGITTVGFITASSLQVSGITTLGVTTVSQLSSAGIITAPFFSGSGINLVGIVTQITVGTGLSLTSSQLLGKGTVQVGIKTSIGKTIYVSYLGSDANTGLVESDAKRTIKAAAALALPGDTIKVFPGTFVENNPITLAKNVSIQGTELRNCTITPQYLDRDLFYVNNGCHMTNLNFNGSPATNNAAVISFVPLAGVSSNRFFDAARMIRLNLDYIANETVGYLTSTQYRNPVFSIGVSTIRNCKEDIVSIFKAVCFDITRGGNSKSVGAGKSYYTEAGALQHIVGVKTETIDALNYAAGIARAVVNNVTWGSNPVGIATSVTNAIYNNTTGITTITAVNHGLSKDDAVKVVGLGFTCPSGIATLTYPTGSLGYIFNVKSVVGVNTFEVVVGQSTLPHTYVSGGTVQKYTNFQNNYTQVKDLGMQADSSTGFNNAINGCANVVSAIYSCVGIITTIIDQGLSVLGAGINTTYPADYDGQTSNNWSSSKIGLTTYSPGVGNIDKGPYIRNCTNFIANSIGLKVDGFTAEPGDQDDIGVTGSMSVDSYTQYNQGGIGVSITNGGYAQLVSIFTICDDIAIYTASGGQCDITNSNSSFGNYGLYAIGVGDNTTRSIYRYTGTATTEATARANVITISGVGTNRPYDGQSCYFGTLYYSINTIRVDGGGSGYTGTPTVTITSPTGPNGVVAQASATVVNGSVTAINLLNSGSQYLGVGASVTIAGPAGAGTTATASVSNYQPIYYKVAAATLPSAGISTVTFLQTLNNTVSAGTTVYFARGSLQLASTISFEHVGAGTNIFTAKPALGGVVIPENKVVQLDGGTVTYTSTDQSGNFNIGDGVVINQSTGEISGRDFTKALFTTMTPFILALSD
jgi:hypothetical protein